MLPVNMHCKENSLLFIVHSVYGCDSSISPLNFEAISFITNERQHGNAWSPLLVWIVDWVGMVWHQCNHNTKLYARRWLNRYIATAAAAAALYSATVSHSLLHTNTYTHTTLELSYFCACVNYHLQNDVTISNIITTMPIYRLSSAATFANYGCKCECVRVCA